MEKIRLLMLEDNREDAELVINELQKTGSEFDIRLAANMSDFTKLLDEFKPQIILSDYSIPGFSGIKGLEIAKNVLPDVPYIFVSGHIGEDRAIEALKKGATDYVLKDRLAKLVPTINRVLKEIGEVDSWKSAEKSLKQFEKNYGLLFENNLAGIFDSTFDGKIIRCNEACVETFGYDSNDELCEIPLNEHFADPEVRLAILETIKVSGRLNNVEVKLKKKDGSFFWGLANIGIVQSPGSANTYIQGILFDITEQKKAVEDIILAKEKAEEADKIKSEFLAQVSHEIRTPLNVILSYHLMLKDELSDELKEENNYIFDAIELAGRRLIRTIDQILNMSALSSGKMELSFGDTNLYNLLFSIRDEFGKFAESKGLQLHFKNKIAEPEIVTDIYILEKIFQNLVDNAIKYTNAGTVDIIIYRNILEEICVDISDTGIGISEEYQKKIFEPFSQEDRGYTRRYEGLGLGLALVKRCIDLLGYKLLVKSEKGKGSVFTIVFTGLK